MPTATMAHRGRCPYQPWGRGCVLTFLLLAFLPTITSFLHIPLADLEPVDPIIEEGDTLIVNCTLNDNYNRNYTAKDLYFMLNSHNYSKDHVHVLTNRTAQLVLPNVTVIESDYSDVLTCHDPSGQSLYAHTVVSLARRPLQPILEACVVDDWRNMTCWWGPSVEDQDHWVKTIHTAYNLSWNISKPRHFLLHNYTIRDEDHRSTRHTWLPPYNQKYMCMGETYLLYLEASNKLTNVKNLTRPYVQRNIDPCTIVKPQPVTNLQFRVESDRYVTLTWTAPHVPEEVKERDLVYYVEYTAMWGNQELNDSMLVSAKTSVKFKAKPFTEYKTSVRVRPKVGGNYSDSTQIQLTTPQEVPEKNPNISTLGFELTTCNSESERGVTLYWQELDPKFWNGEGLEYRVQIRPSHSPTWHTVEERTDNLSHVVCVDKARETELRVIALNSKGRALSEPTQYFLVPTQAQEAMPPQYIVEGEDKEGFSLVHFTWEAGLNVTAPPARVKREVTEYASGVTIFWCKGNFQTSICNGEVRWKRVPALPSNYSMQLERSYLDYRFGLALEQPHSSGLKWSSCQYAYYEEAEAPKSVKVHKGKSSGKLNVEITVPKCHSAKGYAWGFDILYCLPDHKDACQGEENYVHVARGPPRASPVLLHTLSVSPGMRYKVIVHSVTWDGRRSKLASGPFFITAPANWASAGAVAGIAVAGIFAVAFSILGVLTVCRYIRKKKRQFVGGMLITPPPITEKPGSVSSRTPMLDNYVNGHGPMGNGYCRQESNMSTQSLDSGTGSMNYEQLSPAAPEVGHSRKPRHDRFTSIPEDTDEVFQEGGMETYQLTPTKDEPPRELGSGQEQETSFTQLPAPRPHTQYANVDEYTRVAFANDSAGWPNNVDLPLEEWDPHKSPNHSSHSRGGSPIDDYSQAQILGAEGGSCFDITPGNAVGYVSAENPWSRYDSSSEDQSIGPASLMNSSSDKQGHFHNNNHLKQLPFEFDPNFPIPVPNLEFKPDTDTTANTDSNSATQQCPSSLQGQTDLQKSAKSVEVPKTNGYITQNDMSRIPGLQTKNNSGYISQSQVPTVPADQAQTHCGYISQNEVPPVTSGHSQPETGGYITHAEVPSVNHGKGGYGCVSQEGVPIDSHSSAGKGYITQNQFPHSTQNNGYIAQKDIPLTLPNPSLENKGDLAAKCQSQRRPEPSDYVAHDDMANIMPTKCASSSPSKGAAASGAYVLPEDLAKGRLHHTVAASNSAPTSKVSSPKLPTQQRKQSHPSYISADEAARLWNGRGTQGDAGEPQSPNGYVCLDDVNTRQLLGVDKGEKEEESYMTDSPEAGTVDFGNPWAKHSDKDGYLKLAEAERQGLLNPVM